MRRTLLSFFVAGLGLAAGACTTYRIRSAEDHGAMRVLKLETVKTTQAILWTEVENQYWLCQDQGDDLVCERACGYDRDVQCPTVMVNDNGITTNTR